MTPVMVERCSSPTAALTELTALVNYVRVTVGEPDDDTWLPAERLVHDESFLYDVMRSNMDARGIERDDVGLSLIVLGYAFRIASVAIGTWLLAGRTVDVSPDKVSIQFGRNRPNAVRVERAAWADDIDGIDPHDGTDRADSLAVLHRHLIDDHLAPMIDTSRRAARVGERMMWANVASSCASSFGALMEPLATHRLDLRAAAQRFFEAARPELRHTGSVVPIGPTWAWQRSACCLYYQIADASMCDECSLHDADARAARVARILAETAQNDTAT